MAATTPERREQMRAYHDRVKVERNARKRAERIAAPEPLRAAARERYLGWTEEEREAHRERNRQSLAKLRSDVLAAYGGACACCGNAYEAHLTLDHVDGGGRQERLAVGNGQRIYRRLRQKGYPPGFQILCWNCNAAKHTLGRCGCGD